MSVIGGIFGSQPPRGGGGDGTGNGPNGPDGNGSPGQTDGGNGNGGGDSTPPVDQTDGGNQTNTGNSGSDGSGTSQTGTGNAGSGQTVPGDAGSGDGDTGQSGPNAANGAAAAKPSDDGRVPYVALPGVTAELVDQVKASKSRLDQAFATVVEEGDRARAFAEAAQDRQSIERLIASVQPAPERAPSLREGTETVRRIEASDGETPKVRAVA